MSQMAAHRAPTDSELSSRVQEKSLAFRKGGVFATPTSARAAAGMSPAELERFIQDTAGLRLAATAPAQRTQLDLLVAAAATARLHGFGPQSLSAFVALAAHTIADIREHPHAALAVRVSLPRVCVSVSPLIFVCGCMCMCAGCCGAV